MRLSDSTLDMAALHAAQVLLTPPPRREPLWPALVAATTLALTAVVFAMVMVLAPPVPTEHVAKRAPD